MNLYEKYDDFCKKQLHEQFFPRFIRDLDIGFPPVGGGMGKGPNNINPPSPGSLPDRGAIRGYIQMLQNGDPASWWRGTPEAWVQILDKWKKLTILLRNASTIGGIDIQTLWALWMRALYNPNNRSVWGAFMRHPIFTTLTDQGWNWDIDPDSGTIALIYDSINNGPLDTSDPLTMWAINLSQLLSDFPFPPNP